jgi:hypothetical protein
MTVFAVNSATSLYSLHRQNKLRVTSEQEVFRMRFSEKGNVL